MKMMRLVVPFVLFGVGCGMVAPDFAAAQFGRPPVPGRARVGIPRVRVVAPRAVVRVPVVTHPGWPLKRPPRPVVVRPPRVTRVRVEPRLFLPPVIFGGVVVTVRQGYGYGENYGYSRDNLAWQDSETLYREDEWVEFTLDCNARGRKLWFEILDGRVRVDWAEVVFDNGEVQVVEFPDRSFGPGLYELLDFRDGRRVDSVRMVAEATSREATVTLWLER